MTDERDQLDARQIDEMRDKLSDHITETEERLAAQSGQDPDHYRRVSRGVTGEVDEPVVVAQQRNDREE
jgi:hypothetical protein